jgi:hypothetical protein
LAGPGFVFSVDAALIFSKEIESNLRKKGKTGGHGWPPHDEAAWRVTHIMRRSFAAIKSEFAAIRPVKAGRRKGR